MSKSPKIAIVLLAIALLSCMVFAPVGAEGKLAPIKVTVYTGTADLGQPKEEDPIHKYIREELGIDLEYIYEPGDADQRLNLMLASGDYPDIIYAKTGVTLDNYVLAGAMAPLDDLAAKDKNTATLWKIMRQYREKLQGRFKEKKFWYLPTQIGYSKERPLINPILGFRYDLWKKVGYPKPKTIDEYYKVLQKMQKANPTQDGRKVYAFGGWLGDGWGQWATYCIMRYAGKTCWTWSADNNNHQRRTYAPFDKDFVYAAKLLNKALREGYADPEAAIMKYNEYLDKLRMGLYAGNWYAGDWLDGDANRARNAAGQPEQRLIPWVDMKYSNYKGKPLTGQYAPTGWGGGVWFTKNCKNLPEVFRRLSWLWTDEGQILTGMGVKGIHWDPDAKGFRKPTEEVIKTVRNNNNWRELTGICKWQSAFPCRNGFDPKGDAYDLPNNKYYEQSSMDPVDREILAKLGAESYQELPGRGDTLEDHWVLSLDYPAGSEMADLNDKLDKLLQEYLPKLYQAKTDKDFSKVLAEFKDKAVKLGYKKLEDDLNRRVEEYWAKYQAGLKD